MPPLHHPEPPLAAPGIVLRAPRPGDADAITAACQDPEIPRWTLVPSPYAREDAERWLASQTEDAASGRQLAFLVVDERDRLLGSVSLVEVDLAAAWGEIGYWVAREARGRGVASSAVVLVRDWAHAALGLATLELNVHRDNPASARTAERAGFRTDGVPVLGPTRCGSTERAFLRYVHEAPSARYSASVRRATASHP